MHLCIGVDYVTLLTTYLRVFVVVPTKHCNHKDEGILEIFISSVLMDVSESSLNTFTLH